MNSYILASNLLYLWENAARRLAPDEHLRWQQRLGSIPDGASPEDLRNALMPLVAKSDKEQELFRSLFADALALSRSSTDAPAGPEPDAHVPAHDPIIGVAIGAYLLLTLLAVALWFMLPRTTEPESSPARPPAGTEKDFGLQPGQKALFRPSDVVLQDSVSPVRFTLDSINGKPATAPAVALGSIRVSGDTTITLVARDTSRVTDTLLFSMVFPDSSREKLTLRVTVNRTPPVQVTLQEQPLPNLDDRLRKLAFRPDNRLFNMAPLIRFASLILLALALYWFLRWRARRRKKLIAERNRADKPPYVWNISLPDQAKPDPGDDFAQTLNALRRRTETEIRLLDMPGTVQATIRKAGMAEFRFRQLSQPPEYLLLIEQRGDRDHRTRLFDALYQTLVANDIIAERFFFDGPAQLFWNEQAPDGLTYDELYLRFPNHRLLLFSSGRNLFSQTSGKLAKWTGQIARWKDRALLTPLPYAEWGRRERILNGFFRFAPASLNGMRRVLEDFESDTVAREVSLEKLAPLAPGEQVLLEDGDLIATLEKYYPDPITRRWLAVMAVWPELHYDLSLWLGHWLAQEFEQPVATMARFSNLLRLPWFARGEMPDPARADLIDWLRRDSPGLEDRLRKALYQLLEKNGPPGDSTAWDAYAMRLAFNEWMICSDPARKKELENRIAAWMDENPDVDFITVRELNGQPGPLDNLLPDAWKKRLFKGRLPGLGLRDSIKDLLYIAAPVWIGAALLLGFGWNPREATCNGSLETVAAASDTIQICDDTDEKKLLIWEYKLRKAAAGQDSLLFGDLLRQQPAVSADSLLRKARQNAATAAFNAGVPGYSMAEKLRSVQPGFRSDTSRCRQGACRWFSLALAADSSLLFARAGDNWCASQPEPPVQYPCYRIIRKNTYLLNRELPFRELTNSRDYGDAVLGTLNLGQTVELLDSTPWMWKVRYIGTDGFIARGSPGNPSMEPCEQVRDTILPVLLPDMAAIPGGTFLMGSAESEEDADSDERPRHEVTLSSFRMSRTEVTLGQFRSFVQATGYVTDAEKEGSSYAFDKKGDWGEQPGVNWRHDERGKLRRNDRYPVIHVSWNDAIAYCNWLSEYSGLMKVYVVEGDNVTVLRDANGYRLPTEAQWEYAAGNGARHTRYSWGDGPPEGRRGGNVADETARKKFPDWTVFEGYSDGFVYGAPAGSFEPNDFGLYDMTGNVWEWCWDWFGDYDDKAQTNPQGAEEGLYRVVRGGSWGNYPRRCRVACRGRYDPDDRYDGIGFRLVLVP